MRDATYSAEPRLCCFDCCLCVVHTPSERQRYENGKVDGSDDVLSKGLTRCILLMQLREYSTIRSAIACTWVSSEPPVRATRLQIDVISELKTLSESPSVCACNARVSVLRHGKGGWVGRNVRMR